MHVTGSVIGKQQAFFDRIDPYHDENRVAPILPTRASASMVIDISKPNGIT